MYDTNSLIEKEILSRKEQIEVKFEEFEAKFKLLVDEKEVDLNSKVNQLLEQPARAKWKADFQLQWSKFKSVEKQRWIDRLLTFFLCQFKFDLYVADCKKTIRRHIRQLFTIEEAKQWTQLKKTQEFDQVFDAVVAKAKIDHPEVNVKKLVGEVYTNNKRLMGLQIDLYHPETVDDVNESRNELHHNNIKIKEEIATRIANCVEQEQMFIGPVVDKVVDIVIQVTEEYNCTINETQFLLIFAKKLVTILLEKKQKLWESLNSVPAKLERQREEMRNYFDSVSQGIEDTQLLVKTLGVNLRNILPKSFEKELIRMVDSRVGTKN